MTKQTQSFQAETKELLNLMAHSLYSHREIFLRELISNASDAIEKLKFESLTQPGLASLTSAFEIRLEADKEKKTLSIIDNGIGIPPENLTLIFNHGFTTRKEGHGFGLHSAALAAMEMGGSLKAESDGLQKGATFTLQLPLAPQRNPHR